MLSALVYYVKRNYKINWDYVVLSIPFVKKYIQVISLTFFLQTLALLLKGGVRLVDAIKIATKPTSNLIIKSSLEVVAQDVSSGVPLSQALQKQTYLYSQELESLYAIGEATGTLPLMIEQAGQLYNERVHKYLTFFTSILQPVLLMILGLLVGMLLVAVYVPLLTLSYSLG